MHVLQIMWTRVNIAQLVPGQSTVCLQTRAHLQIAQIVSDQSTTAYKPGHTKHVQIIQIL